MKQFEASAKLGLYMSGIKGDAASAEGRALIDCGTGRFRLIKDEDGELKEEEIQDASDWGNTDDQIDKMADREATRAAG